MSDQVKHLHMLAEFRLSGYRIEKGRAMEVHPTFRGAKFYHPGASLDTDYETAYLERIEQAMERGLINQGRFDDRKPRFAGIRKEGGEYVVAVGPSHFGETQMTNLAAIKDRNLFCQLRRDGDHMYNDPRAYFAYTFAVDAVPVSSEGHVLYFRRNQDPKKCPIYPGHWQDIGGMLDTDFSFWRADDPSLAFRYNADERMLKELFQEAGVLPSETALELTGMVDGLSTVDITYDAWIGLPSEEMVERWKYARDTHEHDGVVILRTPGELHDFLLEDRSLAPVGVGANLLHLKRVDPDAYASAAEGFSQYPLSFEEAEETS